MFNYVVNSKYLVSPLVVRGKIDIVQEYSHGLPGGRAVGGAHALVNVRLHLKVKIYCHLLIICYGKAVVGLEKNTFLACL